MTAPSSSSANGHGPDDLGPAEPVAAQGLAPSMAFGGLRTAWNDKFARPGAADLVALHAELARGALVRVRAGFGGLSGLQESVDWQGVPWRWTFVFRGTGDLIEHSPPATAGPAPVASPSGLSLLRAFAYVVPEPGKVQVCVPLTGAQIEAMPLKKMKRPVREGIATARSVAGVWWPTWELGGTAADVEDVLDVAGRKHRFLLAAAAVQA